MRKDSRPARWGQDWGWAARTSARLSAPCTPPEVRTADAAAVALVPHLTAQLPSYVSLQTALYHHGMISQIPSAVYAVSLTWTRRYATAVAEFSVYHVAPGWFFGYEEPGERRMPMAVPEKALVDVLYLSPDLLTCLP